MEIYSTLLLFKDRFENRFSLLVVEVLEVNLCLLVTFLVSGRIHAWILSNSVRVDFYFPDSFVGRIREWQLS